MSERLPTFVAKYRRSLDDIKPKVVPLKNKMASIEEKKLRRFFKCTKFNLKTGNRSDQCFVCKNFRYKFDEHLKSKHPKQQFYCCYCYPRLNDENKDKKYMEANALVTHMIEVHRHRRYQCNLCLYRAISAEHVNIHQSVIHPNIHKSTLDHKQLEGKSCRILECPPPTAESAHKKIPTELQLFNNHKYRRLNNDESHNKEYQCVYCNFMNETITKVVEHCVQTHPDFHILYYVPEPLVTSTHSPIRQHNYTEIDVFNPTAEVETQDNRVSSSDSTDPIGLKAWEKNKKICDKEVEELAFKKKPRVSAVQKGGSATNAVGLSHKHLNKDHFPSTSGSRRALKYPIGLQRLGAVSTRSRRLNQLPNRTKAMPKSAKIDFLRNKATLEAKRHKAYESEDSDDAPPKKVPKTVNRPQQSSLPPLLSPQKPVDRKMFCLLCKGNNREITESQIYSHIQFYHNNQFKASGNSVPFMCGYCHNFFDTDSTATVMAHQRTCKEKPERSANLIEKMFLTRDEFLKYHANQKAFQLRRSKDNVNQRTDQRLKERSDERLNERSEQRDERTKSRSDDKPKKPKYKRLVLLSDDEQEELTQSTSSTPSRKPSSSVTKSKQLVKKQASKENTHKARDRYESTASKGFYESEDSISSVPESVFKSDDEEEASPQPSTSGHKTTTTIERAESESEELEITEVKTKDEFICLFCEESTDKRELAIEHMETHFPDIEEAIDDSVDQKVVIDWIKGFVEDQFSYFEEERDVDDSEHHYKCPICVKIGRIKLLRAKGFRNFWQLKSHFWKHIGWTPVKCLICKSDETLPNCDHLIASHLNKRHYEELGEDEDSPLYNLMGNKVKGSFTQEERQALHDEGFIESNRYEPIDSKIEEILNKMSEEYESRLREEAGAEAGISVILPKLVVDPLPPLNFDDDEMVIDYIASCS